MVKSVMESINLHLLTRLNPFHVLRIKYRTEKEGNIIHSRHPEPRNCNWIVIEKFIGELFQTLNEEVRLFVSFLRYVKGLLLEHINKGFPHNSENVFEYDISSFL